jgi:hypothetical protein
MIYANQGLDIQLFGFQRRPNRFLKPVRSNQKNNNILFQPLIRMIYDI